MSQDSKGDVHVSLDDFVEALKTATLEDGTPVHVELGDVSMGEHKHNGNSGSAKPAFTDAERAELQALKRLSHDSKLKVADTAFQIRQLEEMQAKIIADVVRAEEQIARRINEMAVAKGVSAKEYSINSDSLTFEKLP